ncbi:MAG: NERD domain-containing protein [Anaeroplasmataceae bacterium]|nr:NERD domain-containing protein [Anaeroplasmataceae bacterium]
MYEIVMGLMMVSGIIIILLIIIGIWKLRERNTNYSVKSKIYKNQRSINIGCEGEKKISRILEKYSHLNTCYIIENYRAFYKDKSIQIDHLLITPSEIICIETKNYKGKIYGSKDNLNWTIVYNPNDKEKMYNPIRQNANHIKFLYNFLPYNTPIKNIVVFTGTADIEELKQIEEVYTIEEFFKYIYNLNDIIKYDYQMVYEILMTYKLNISDEEHIQNIQKYKE